MQKQQDNETIKPTSIRLNPKTQSRLVEMAETNRRSISKEIEHVLETYYDIIERK